MASAERESIMGGLGAVPPSGQIPWPSWFRCRYVLLILKRLSFPLNNNEKDGFLTL